MTESPALSVLLFGIARDLTGRSSLPSPMPPGGRVGDLLDALRAQYPALSGIKSLLIAVNGEYADADLVLNPRDEIAIIPPVSGG
jgi:molybdopterin converting factor small subunit